jgi:hydroxyacylglutathione hydrolase
MIKFKEGQITVFESALFRTTSTVVINDNLILVVDPNWLPQEVKEIQEFVQANRKNQPLYLLFTHSDYDHIIGYGAFSEAKVIASEAFQNNKEKEKSIDGILQFDDEYYITRDYKIEYPKSDIIVRKDGQKLQIGNTTLTFYLAPGHNPDGFFTIIEPLNIWIAGDYLSNEEFPYIYFSSRDYEQTLKKVDSILETHNINLLIPGHGDIAFDIEEIQKRKTENLQYISDLRASLTEGKNFDLKKLWKKYRFPRIMKRFHEGNVELIKKEIEGETEKGD